MFKIILYFTILLLINTNLFADGTEPIGSGTETDPYQVETLDNLLWISTNSISWNKHFIQITDIDASDTQNWNNGEGFVPIGHHYDRFTGNYNGQYFTINGLYINRSSPRQGLFGSTILWAVIENLGVTNANITGGNLTGAIVGDNGGDTISNCYSTGSVSGESAVGGMAGSIIGTALSNCFSTCIVNGYSLIGGLVGCMVSSAVSNSYFTGSVSGDYNLGGLAGANEHSTISNSHYDYETVLINGENHLTIGALENELYINWLENNLTLNIDEYLTSNGSEYYITNSSDLKKILFFGQYDYHFLLTQSIDLSALIDFYIPYFSGFFNGNNFTIDNLNINVDIFSNVGLFGYTYEAVIENLGVTNIELSGRDYLGGLVGVNTGHTTIIDCYSTGSINGIEYIGGLVGENLYTGSNISNCFSTCIVNGYQSIGGLVGKNYSGAIVSNSYSNGSVYGTNDFVGGLVGMNYYANIINNCYSSGNVVGRYEVGGLAGRNSHSTISNCHSIVNVIGDAYVGGLTGKNSFCPIINECYANGIVNGNNIIGGLVGMNNNSNVINCYNMSSVNGNNIVGGLIAINWNNSLVSNCYNSGSVSGTDEIGGLVGRNEDSNVSNSFWDIETTGLSISVGGTGKTTVEMQNVATYTSLATIGLDDPWDFVGNPFDDTGYEDYWDIDGTINNGYPFLTTIPVVAVEEPTFPNSSLLITNLNNYPNPFNPTTTIEFSIQNDSKVELSIYNIKGQKIKTLAQNEFAKGSHSVIWNGDNESGRAISSGVYLYKLKVNGKTKAMRKCLLLK